MTTYPFRRDSRRSPWRQMIGFDALEDRIVPADTTPPLAFIDSAPLKTTPASMATFVFHGEDSESGIDHLEYRLDTAAFTTGTSPVTFTGLAAGEHSFQVQAFDQAGNVSLVPATYFWAVQATDDSRFVERLYHQILGRAPDEAGLSGWAATLGASSGMNVAQGIWESAEHRELQVNSYYQLYLGRAADPVSRQAWTSQLVDGVSEEAVIAGFVSSAEYQSVHPLPQPFVDSLYTDLLNRTADPAGEAGWTQALATSSPFQVAQGFIESHERHVTLVNDAYFEYLGRVPGASEAAPWVENLDAGMTDQDLAVLVLASSENFALAQSP